MELRDDKNFGRLAVMLLALAGLAERAGNACLPVRLLVLWLLRYAEATARAHAVDLAPSPCLIVRLQRHSQALDDAASLAEDLRALACVFRILAHCARLAPPQTLRRAILPTRHPSIADHLRTLAARLAPWFDTS